MELLSRIHPILGSANWLAIAATALLLVLAVLFQRRYLSPISDVPGPAWASLTRLWHMHEIWSGHQNLTILRLHDELGHFVRIAPGEVSTTHPDAIKKLILTPQLKGHWYKIMRFPDWRFRTAMSILEPKAKVEFSKQLAPAYAMTNVIKSEDQITRYAEHLLGWMDKYAATHEPMNLAQFFTYTAFDVVADMVFSEPFGFIEKGVDIGDSIAQTLKFESYISLAGFFRWLHNLLIANPLITWLDVMPTNYLSKTSNAALERRRKNQEARWDFVAHWLKAHEENPDKLPYCDLQSAVMANVGAGSDTVSCALQSAVYHMIRQPDTWSRARREIEEAQRREGICRGRVISYSDALKLPYLQACIKEALRIFHPVSMGTVRVVPKGGITIGDRFLPAGTTISLNTFSMNLSTEVWGPDAKRFRPERWMAEDTSSLERNFLPFSAGIGACVGQHLAKIELSKILSTIIRDYDIEQVDPSQEWSYRAYFTTVPGDWPVYIRKAG